MTTKKRSPGTRRDARRGAEGIDIDPFQVGMRCEGKFNDGWYPAVITAVAGGAYTVVYIGFGNTEVVDADGIRPLICDDPLDPAQVVVGAELVGRYSGDGKYYDVVVEAVTDFGYKVSFTEREFGRATSRLFESAVADGPVARRERRTSKGGGRDVSHPGAFEGAPFR